MWIIIDLIVIAIVAISVWYFKSKGFLKASETLISLLLTFCLIPLLLPVVENIVSESAVGQGIQEKVEEKLGAGEKDSEIGLPDFMEKSLEKPLQEIEEKKADLARNISGLIIRVISFIILLIVIKLLIFILFKTLNLTCKFKIFGFMNKTLGVLLGLINGVIIVYVLCAVAVALIPVEHLNEFKEAVSKTVLTQFFYNNNIILNLFIK